MRRPTDKPSAAEKADFPRRKSGRATFDANGRSIWEWQTATGVFERDVTSEQLAKLEDSNLALIEDDPTNRAATIYGNVAPAKVRARSAAPAKPVTSTVLSRLLKKIGGH
jgi:hypothetical protein